MTLPRKLPCREIRTNQDSGTGERAPRHSAESTTVVAAWSLQGAL